MRRFLFIHILLAAHAAIAQPGDPAVPGGGGVRSSELAAPGTRQEPPTLNAASAVNVPIRKVILDPGHGGADAGEVGPGGLREKDVTMSLAQKIAQFLEGSIEAVLVTRDGDKHVPIEGRVSGANRARGDIFISLHTGANRSMSAAGIEAFCPLSALGTARGPIQSDALADTLLKEMAAITGATNRGIRHAPCRVFQGLSMTGVLLEVGCITTPSEEALLRDDAYLTKLAQGIASGVLALNKPR